MRISALLMICSGVFLISATSFADSLDDYVKQQMRKYGIPGLSMAVVDDGMIASVRCYGIADPVSRRPVKPNTLFQAGSISKSVAAIVALRAVEAGALTLDGDVNAKLKTWKVPENEYTRNEKVTLRRILSHTAGLTVHGFAGYAVDRPVPNLVQVLEGAAPANSPAIVVDVKPGTEWRYSGGGYTVMQQLLLDTFGGSFPAMAKKAVLGPCGMTDSSYEQPQPADREARTAAGTYADGTPVQGRWHIYPEMAAAGLWTTPTDLAKFILAVEASIAGNSGSVLSQRMALEMLTDQKGSDGLGTFLQGTGETLRFNHGGRDEGFDAFYLGYAYVGKGVAIMINANENAGVVQRIVKKVAADFNWPDYPRLATLPGFHPARTASKESKQAVGYFSNGTARFR